MLWLTEHLSASATLLMVSHDRDLLNDVCDHIARPAKLVTYNGNYDRFERTRAERLEHTPRSGQDRRPAQACRPSSTASRPRRASAPGAVARQDDRKLGPVVADRRAVSSTFRPRAARSPMRRSTRSRRLRDGLPSCASSICGSTWTTASPFLARTATANRPSSGCCRIACSRVKASQAPRLRIGYSQDQEEGLTTRRRRSST